MERSETCPLTRKQVVDEYFLENRNRLLEIAAFLDRLDRARESGSERDFRVRAFREALEVLTQAEPQRLHRIQMLLSDPTAEPREALDQKSAIGAYDHWSEEAR